MARNNYKAFGNNTEIDFIIQKRVIYSVKYTHFISAMLAPVKMA